MRESIDLAILIREQHGLASRKQLLDLLGAGVIRRRLQREWRMVLPGVVATFTGRLDPGQRLIAGQLYAGPEAVLSSWTATIWHGVESARYSPLVRLSVPSHLGARQTAAVLVTRTTRPDPAPWNRPPLRFSSRPRAVIDAARETPDPRRAKAIVIEAVQRGLVTAEALRHELECGPRARSGWVRRALDLAEAGAWSIAEADLLETLTSSRILPEIWPNPKLASAEGVALPTPDAWIDEVGLAVQVHSRTYHLRDEDWEATVSTDTALGAEGIVVLGVTPSGLTANPAGILGRVERAYLSFQGRPRPAVVAVPRLLA